MASLAIVLGFALMLFLPCAIALWGSREPKSESSAYADRIVETRAARRTASVASTTSELLPVEWGDITDPIMPSRNTRTTSTRLELAEFEVLRARSVAARAQAEALAAIARAAAAKAEIADAEALALEAQVSQATRDIRKAA